EAERLKGNRNLFTRFCSQRKTQYAYDPEILRDVLAVESRFHRAYNRALAMQHNCVFDSIDNAIRPTSALQESFDRLVLGKQVISEEHALPLPPGFLQYLAELPLDDFQMLLKCNEQQIRRWWHLSDGDALKAVFRDIGKQACLVSSLPKFVEIPLKMLVLRNEVRIFVGGLLGAGVGALVDLACGGGGLVGSGIGAGAGPLVEEKFANAMELSE